VTVNAAASPVRVSAWLASSAEALADSWAFAATCCVTSFSCSTAWFTCVTPVACCSLADAISAMTAVTRPTCVLISPRLRRTSSLSASPRPALCAPCSMSAAV
jgi:hypothetical protein